MTSELRVGVIGVGAMGECHARNLHRHSPGARLAAVMDVATDRAAEIARPAGADVFDDAEALIASDGVDAVVVASPDGTHGSLAAACLAHGKPAMIEKPLATDLDAARDVVEREAAGGRRLLQVGFTRRYDPQHTTLADAIRDGVIGRPLLFRGWHRNPPEARPPSSAQVLVNAAIHDLDSARWLLGQEIEEIRSLGTVVDPARGDGLELQVITMTMSEGAVAVVEVNKNVGFGYEVGVEVTGTEGMVTTPLPDAPIVRRGDGVSQHIEADFLQRFAVGYRLEIEAWARAAAGGGATGPTAWDGLASLAAATAAAGSLEHGTPRSVDLPPRPAFYGTRS